MIYKILCWFGVHRDIVNEERNLKSWSEAEGDHYDNKSTVECRCGVVIQEETHRHTTHSKTVYARDAVPAETRRELETIAERA